jgi:DNA-directed RNA polymerase sigma subunit (sigma70/sigma32)
MLGCLSGREQTSIVRRFGLAGDKQTLVQLGREPVPGQRGRA